MAFTDWLRKSVRAVHEDGLGGASESAYQLYLGAWKRTNHVYDYGQNVVDVNDAWDAYRENLQYVLDDVERLLENVDAPEVVITADHGNLFGEWGLYGHENGVTAPVLRRVPWCRTSAEDDGSVDLEITNETPADADDEAVQQRLRELGYL